MSEGLEITFSKDLVAKALSTDARLRPLLKKNPGLRLPSGWDGFEIAVRAVIGQQVSVAAARTLTARLAQHHGTTLATPFEPELTHLFPTPEALVDVDLTRIGLTRARASTISGLSRALLEGRVDFQPERTLEDFTARWVALPGIGPWTANYIALRATGHPDAFPADDLVLQKAVPTDGSRMTARALSARAEAWRPWRAAGDPRRSLRAAATRPDRGTGPRHCVRRHRSPDRHRAC